MYAICCRIFSLITVHVFLDFSKASDLFVHKLNSRYDFHFSAMGMVSSFLWDFLCSLRLMV
jgi:hypothetical protein